MDECWVDAEEHRSTRQAAILAEIRHSQLGGSRIPAMQVVTIYNSGSWVIPYSYEDMSCIDDEDYPELPVRGNLSELNHAAEVLKSDIEPRKLALEAAERGLSYARTAESSEARQQEIKDIQNEISNKENRLSEIESEIRKLKPADFDFATAISWDIPAKDSHPDVIGLFKAEVTGLSLMGAKYDWLLESILESVRWQDYPGNKASAFEQHFQEVSAKRSTTAGLKPTVVDIYVEKAVTRLLNRKEWMFLFKELWFWDGERWIREDEELLNADVHDAAIGESGLEKDLTSSAANEAKDRIKVRSTPVVAAAQVLERNMRYSFFDLETGEVINGVAFRNGVLLVEDGEISLAENRREWFYSSGLNYDIPDPADPIPETPMWDKFITDALQEDERDFFQAMIGRTILRDTTGQYMPVLFGEGNTGKGTTTQILTKLMGGTDRVMSERIETLGGRFTFQHARDKALMVLSDMRDRPKRGAALDDWRAGAAVLKELLGGDPTRIEKKNGDTESAFLRLPVWGATNFDIKWMQGSEDASAWQRRIRPIVFDKVVPERLRIADLPDLIYDREGGAVALKCIRAWLDAKRKYPAGQIPMPRRSADLLDEWMEGAMTDEAKFARDWVMQADGSQLANKEILEAFSVYAGVTLASLKGREKRIYDAIKDAYDVEVGRAKTGGYLRNIKFTPAYIQIDKETF